MVGDSVPELRWEAEALGADAVALAEAHSLASRQRAGAFGAMDLRLGWDLGQRADQIKAEKRSNDERPHLLILSPMCLSLSRLQHAKPDVLTELREQGKRHLEFACSLARLQIERGGRVLFEYPLAASEDPCLWKRSMACAVFDAVSVNLERLQLTMLGTRDRRARPQGS